MIAAMRLALAAAGLLIIYLDPVEPDRFVPATYTALVLYTVYSATVAALIWRGGKFARRIGAGSYWIDVGSYAVLVALSSGTNSIFFFGFFFAIVVSSFRNGFRAGLRVTVVSVVLFAAVGLLTSRFTSKFEVNRLLLRPIDLAILGYMIAYWGGHQLKLARRLALLNEVSRLNPRFGFDRTIGSMLERLRSFHDADACLLVAVDRETSTCTLRRADKRDPGAAARGEIIDRELADLLLHAGGESAFVYSGPHRRWWQLPARKDPARDSHNSLKPGDDTAIERIANLLEAVSLVSVPLPDQSEGSLRIYIATRRPRAFDRTDEALLQQVSEHVGPVLQNIRLADRLASEAAERERQRIARDIHDSIIQPYIGLQMGLAGVRRRLELEETDATTSPDRLLKLFSDAAADTDRLIEMTADGISDLRSYVHGLRELGGENNLMAAIRRFADKFSQATNIVVQVRTDADIQMSDRISTEVFQMVVEGLSNIRRHTQSQRGFIGLEYDNRQLILRIENDGARGSVPNAFTPRSIAERAESLGGRASVQLFGEMGTSVIVEIPVKRAWNAILD